MKNKISKLDNAVKLSVVLISVAMAISFFYYFLIRPSLKDRSLKKCLLGVESQYKEQKDLLRERLELINKENSEKEIEKQQLEEKKGELSNSLERQITSVEMKDEFDKRKSEMFDIRKCNNGGNRLLCLDDSIEKSVIWSYKKENNDYKQVEDELNLINDKINNLKKEAKEIDLDLKGDRMESKLEDDKNFCIKLY